MESNKTNKPKTFEILSVAVERILSTALGDRIRINRVICLTEKGVIYYYDVSSILLAIYLQALFSKK